MSGSMKQPIREQVMRRAGERCEAHVNANCGVHAEQVHHILKREHGGRNDMPNLLAICHPCHKWIHTHEDLAIYRRLLRRPTGIVPRTKRSNADPLTYPVKTVFNTCQAGHPVWDAVTCVLRPAHDGKHRGVLHSKVKGVLDTSWPLQQWERAS